MKVDKCQACANGPLDKNRIACTACNMYSHFVELEKIQTDEVKNPSHYTFGKIEVLNAIEDWKLPYHLGNVVKYIARAGRKSKDTELQDLKKAQFYLERYIKNLEATN